MPTIRFVLKRLAAQRLLALAMIVTLGFSVGVLVAGPVYANASREAILSSSIHSADVTVKNVRVTEFASVGFDYAAADRQLHDAAAPLPTDTIRRQGTSIVRLVAGGGETSAPLLFRDGGIDEIGTIHGRGPTGPAEVLLQRDMADSLGLDVGDTVVAAGAGRVRVALTMTGTYLRPVHPVSDFWYGSQSPFPAPESTEPSPAILTPQGYVQLADRLGLTSRFAWDLYLDLTETRFAQAQALPGKLGVLSFPAGTPLAGSQFQTALPEILGTVEDRTENLRIPVYLVVFQIGAVALAVLAGVASLALSRQSFELAVLRSRGFTRGKLVSAQAVQVLVTAILGYPVGLAIGAGLARLATHANGPTPPGTRYPIELSTPAMVAGAIGAVVAIALLLLLSIPVIRRTIVEERRNLSREARPLLSRVPVELFVFPLGAAAFYEVKTRGFLPVTEKGSLDPLVVFAPTLLIFAASFLALRILLWVLRALERPIGSTRSLAMYLAGRRLGRSPGTSFAISLLLLLTIGLLVVSTSYRATVIRNHEDAAHQEIGGDYQAVVSAPHQSLTALADLPPGSTPLIRTDPQLHRDFSLPPTALAIDPGTYADGGWWRADYSSLPESQILSSLSVPDPGVVLPEGTEELRVRFSASLSPGPGSRGLTLAAVTAGADGIIQAHSLGALTEREREVTVSVDGARSLLSIVIGQPGSESPDRLELEVGVRAVAGGVAHPVPLGGWQGLTWRGADARVAARGRGAHAVIDPGVGHVTGGIVPPQPPLPALTSNAIALPGQEFEATVGGQRFQFRCIGNAQYFPSAQADFLVMPIRPLLLDTLRVPETGIDVNEVWSMGGDPREDLRRAGFAVRQEERAATRVEFLSQLPQSLAVGMHFTAAAGGMALIILGVAVALYFTQRRREFEFASLRAMGSRPRQVAAVLLIEQVLLIGYATVAGLGLGFGVLRLMMPYFGKSLGVAIPPPILVLDWGALGAFGLAVAAAAALGIGLAIRAVLTSSVTSILRGEAE